MIHIHTATNRMETLTRFVDHFHYNIPQTEFRLCLNLQFKKGTDDYKRAEEILHGSNISGFIMDPNPYPSMTGLRRALQKFSRGNNWMMFGDGNFFREGSSEFYIECFEFMEEFKQRTGRTSFMGCAGGFGSNSHKDRIHLSRRNPLMPEGSGLLFHRDINFSYENFKEVDELIGGMEDLVFCAMAITPFDAVPFKRFRCPSKMSHRNYIKRKESFIHNWEVWNQYAMDYVRRLAAEPDWLYPRDMKHKGHNVSSSPRSFMKYVKNLEGKFSDGII